jgi:hypothetical protein
MVAAEIAGPPLDPASRDTAASAVGAAKAVVCADAPLEAGAGAGRWRTRSTRSPARRVVFVERGSGVDRPVAATQRPHGTVEYTSAPGPNGIRQIVAIATVNDQPVIFHPHAAEPGELVVASYRAAGPTRLGAVRKTRARRQGTRLLVSFDRVRGAKSTRS